MMFSISDVELNRDELLKELANEKAGAIVVFEGWVRDHNEGKKVSSLEYQIYRELALKEGERILQEAREKFNLHAARSVHREGHLKLNEVAVWIGATASHRDDAFKATRYVIDEIKHRLPVWKKEHYIDLPAEWVFCRHHSHHVHFEESEYYQKQSGVVDQSKLKRARVLVIGAGGLGCPVLTNLASAGVGTIGIVDFDKIDISNIHRQTLFSPNLVGEMKAVVAAHKMKELNPFISVKPYNIRFDSHVAYELLADYDLVLDCTDNMQTKFLIHDFCFNLRKPLISASVYKHEGQIRTFLPGNEAGCLRCHGGQTPDDALLGNCNDIGVLGVTTSVMGSLQASEAVQFIQTGTNKSLSHTQYFSVDTLSQMSVKNTRVISCETCEGKAIIEKNELEVNRSETQGMTILDIRNLSDAEVFSSISKHSKVALCCHKGVRSKNLAETFRQDGHEHVFSLKGGACSL